MAYDLKLETVAVIGNGIIGHGIAQIFAMAGYRVRLIGRSSESLATAQDKIARSLDDFVRHGLIDAAGKSAAIERLAVSTELQDAAGGQLVIEAVTEDLPLKLRIFGELDALCPPPAVLASSSGQPASALVDRVKYRDRVIATHFWYPPQLIPLVEVCAGPETNPELVPWICDVLNSAGKAPAVIDREVPGFIGNRLQFAMLREAWSLWAAGIASAEAIDTVVKTSFGRRVGITGPLESADIGGLRTMVSFGASLIPHLSTTAHPPDAVKNKLDTGAARPGVYDWTERDANALVSARMDELFRWLKHDKAKI